MKSAGRYSEESGQMNRFKGFTLIELLVVISIVALLLSILMPGLRNAKKQAQATVCKSNLRQIGLAAILYMEDFDSYLPRGGDLGTWFQCFLPYIGHEKNLKDYREVDMYICPSFPDKEQTICYVISSWTFRDGDDNVGYEIWEPTKISTFRRPSTTIYMADNEDGYWRPIIQDKNDPDLYLCDVWHPTHISSSDSEDFIYGRRVARSRHRDGCNVVYLGWHSEWMKGSEMTVDMWRDK